MLNIINDKLDYKEINSNTDEVLKKLDEQSGAAVVSGHVGSAGNNIDNPFSGPFVGTPNLIEPLKKQLTDREQKRKDMEDAIGKDYVGIEHPVGGYHKTEPSNQEAYKELQDRNEFTRDYNTEVTPVVDLTWKFIKSDLKFDKFTKELDKETYTNLTNKMKEITKKLDYEDLEMDEILKMVKDKLDYKDINGNIDKLIHAIQNNLEINVDKYKNSTNKMKKINLNDIYKEKTKIASKALVNKTDKWQEVPNLFDVYGDI